MLNLKVNYIAHRLLSSKYKIIYTFIVYLLILFIFNNENYLYCMMENNSGSDTNTPSIIENSITKKKLSLEEIVRERLATRRRADLGMIYIDDEPEPNYNNMNDEDLYILRHSSDPKIAELIKERDLIFPQEFNMKPLKSYLDPEEYILKSSLRLREQMFAMGDETFIDTTVESKATESIKRSK